MISIKTFFRKIFNDFEESFFIYTYICIHNEDVNPLIYYKNYVKVERENNVVDVGQMGPMGRSTRVGGRKGIGKWR